MRIFGNASSLNLINQLKSYQNTMARSMERITSGYGIVTPADSPVSYAMSERFRTELVDIRARQSNVQSGISLLQTGQTNLDRMIDILNDIKGRITELEGPSNPTDVKHTEIYVEELLAEFGDIAETTHYNEIYLFNSARTPQARSSWVTAFGPDMYQQTVGSASGIRDASDRFTIDNMVQNINRTFVAGEGDLGGNLEQISKTFSGGYLESVQQSFNIDATAAVKDTFDAGTLQAGEETFSYLNTQTQYTLEKVPQPDTTQVQLTERFEVGQQLDLARVNTSQVQVGDRVGDFEVVGLNFDPDDSNHLASMDVKYMGGEQNIAMEAYRGTRLDADDKINTFTEVNQGDVITIQDAGGQQLSGTLSLRALATENTTGRTIDIEEFTVENNQLTITQETGIQRGDLRVNYQFGVPQADFQLSQAALQGTATVAINGQAVDPENYVIEGNNLTFTGNVPQYGDQVTVDYDVSAEQRQIQLQDPPAGEVLEVAINGQAVDPANFNINGNVLEFTGDVAPAFGDQVQVNYQAARGINEFNLGEIPNESPIEVMLNGEAVAADQFTIEGNNLIFVGETQPTYGDEVTVNYEIGTKLTNLNVFDEVNPFPNEGTLQVYKNGQLLEENAENGYTLDGGYILFNGDAQGLEGDTYELRYQIGADVTELQLANMPNEGTMEVTINGERIMQDQDGTNGWSIEGNTLRLHGLAVPEMGDEVVVNYQTGEEFNQMALEQTGVNEETIRVTVNGEELAAGGENGWTFDAATDTIMFNGGGIPQIGDEVQVDYGVGELMKQFELARAPIEGTFQMTINGQALANDAENGFTIEGRTVTLNGNAIPALGDNIEYTFEYTGGADNDADSPVILPSGMETKIQTPFVTDFTLVGLGMDKLDLTTEAGREQALAGIERGLDLALETQVRAGAQEQRLNYSLETLMDREAKVMQADGEIRDAEMEKEMVNYMQAEMMANLTYTMLSQGNLNSSSVFNLLGDTMMMGGTNSFGF